MFFSKPLNMHEFLGAVEKLISPAKTSPRLGSSTPAPAKSRPRTQVDQALAGLRQRLSANAAALFDYNGKVLQAAGELPTAASTEFFQIVSASLTAAEKSGRMLAQPGPENVLILRGGEIDAAAVPLGGGRAAAVFIQRSASSVRLAVAVDELLAVQRNLAALLSKGAPAAPRPAEKAPQAPKSGDAPPLQLPRIHPRCRNSLCRPRRNWTPNWLPCSTRTTSRRSNPRTWTLTGTLPILKEKAIRVGTRT